jgi:O-Antigen ligase
MNERFRRATFVVGAASAAVILTYAAYSRPWYFTNQMYLGGLLFLECLTALVFVYRRMFFLALLLVFLWAGINLPGGGGVWTKARWIILGLGALIGLLISVRERRLHFGPFHLIAFAAVLALLVSTAVSQYFNYTLFKVLSMLLLLAYASTGARIAVAGRESRFSKGLITGCEVFVFVNAILYPVGIEVMGNPNSLGAVMGVAMVPVLLWGTLLDEKPSVHYRRLILYAASIYLAFLSHGRAGILVALLTSALLCFSLRKYRLLIQGTIVLVITVASVSIFRPDYVPSLISSIAYKNSSAVILASRLTPWQSAMENISEHPWFGMGFGTTGGDTADPTSLEDRLASTAGVTSENGSSYLSLLAGVGILGALPWFILLLLIIGTIVRTIAWMRTTGNALHLSPPLAMIAVAGLVHAAFEDWMFAPGNYLCVFFWSLVFILADVAPPAKGLASNVVSRSILGASGSERIPCDV